LAYQGPKRMLLYSASPLGLSLGAAPVGHSSRSSSAFGLLATCHSNCLHASCFVAMFARRNQCALWGPRAETVGTVSSSQSQPYKAATLDPSLDRNPSISSSAHELSCLQLAVVRLSQARDGSSLMILTRAQQCNRICFGLL